MMHLHRAFRVRISSRLSRAPLRLSLLAVLTVISSTVLRPQSIAPQRARASANTRTDPAPSPQPHSGLQLLFLGTNGGPPLHLDRSEPSTLLIVDGRPYLIDCGIGTMRRLLRANIQSDHDLGLADVMANDFLRMDLNGSSTVINIYGPPQTEEFVKAAFDYIRIPSAVFAAERPGNPSLINPFKAHEIQGPGLVYH